MEASGKLSGRSSCNEHSCPEPDGTAPGDGLLSCRDPGVGGAGPACVLLGTEGPRWTLESPAREEVESYWLKGGSWPTPGQKV